MMRAIATALTVMLASCAGTPGTDARIADAGIDITWPGPPQQARIRYLYSFAAPENIGIRPGLMKRVVQLFAGKNQVRMLRPYAVAADDDLIVVADPGLSLVHLFRLKESKYAVIRDANGIDLESPIAVSLGVDSIYVADSAAGKVFVFDRKGTLSQTIEGLQRPTGIAFHAASQRLYVTDTLANEIVVFDSVGERVYGFGFRGAAPGQFNFPTSLVLAGDTLLVNDTLNYRVQFFSIDGVPVSSFGEVGDASGQFALSKGLGVDRQGHVYVTDALSNYVQIFDRRGRFLLAFGGMGSDPGQFRLPAGVHVFGDRIFIADSQNGRVQVFEYLGGDT